MGPRVKKSKKSTDRSMVAFVIARDVEPKHPILCIDKNKSKAARSNTDKRSSKQESPKMNIVGPKLTKDWTSILEPRDKKSRMNVRDPCLKMPKAKKEEPEQPNERKGRENPKDEKSRTRGKLPKYVLPKIEDLNPMFVRLCKNKEGPRRKKSKINRNEPTSPRPKVDDAKSRHALLCDDRDEPGAAMSNRSTNSPRRVALMMNGVLPGLPGALRNIEKSSLTLSKANDRKPVRDTAETKKVSSRYA